MLNFKIILEKFNFTLIEMKYVPVRIKQNTMKFIKNFILILIFILPISNSFGAMMTFNQKAEVHDYDTEGSSGLIAGIEFNNDGTKMFISYANRFDNSSVHFINEYSLTTPYDVSTKVYAGDSERCVLTGTDGNSISVSYTHLTLPTKRIV